MDDEEDNGQFTKAAETWMEALEAWNGLLFTK